MANLFSNSYRNFSYWFSETAIDNNGEVVSDINAGITKLIPDFIETLNNTNNAEKRFIIPDCQIGMPDVAAVTFYNYEEMWWYICLENSLSNPFTEYDNTLLYYIFSENLLSDHNTAVNTTSNTEKSKIGTVIELN